MIGIENYFSSQRNGKPRTGVEFYRKGYSIVSADKRGKSNLIKFKNEPSKELTKLIYVKDGEMISLY